MAFILESSWMEKDMGKGSFNGITAKYSKVNGDQEQKMVMVFGNHQKVTTIKATGY